MNDYTNKMQFYYWNELLVQKERGTLDFLKFFPSKVANAALLLKSLLEILDIGKDFRFASHKSKVKTFPKML